MAIKTERMITIYGSKQSSRVIDRKASTASIFSENI